MASIRYTCGCTRYMSPTRLSNFHARRQHEMRLEQVRWHSAPSSPSRWRAASSNPPSQRFPRVSTTNDSDQQIMTTSAGAEDAPTPSESKKSEGNYIGSRLSALAGSVRSARDWTSENAPRLDPKAISKLLSALNLDLPKYQRFLSGTTKMISSSKAGDIERIQRQQLEEKRARVYKKMESIQSNRESHDFEQAMMSTQEGIHNYYASASCDAAVTPVANRVHARADSDETTLVENTQAKILEKVSKIAQILPGADKDQKDPEKIPVTKDVMVARTTVDRRTRGLVCNLKNATSDSSRLNRLEDLCLHLSQYTKFAKNVAIKVRQHDDRRILAFIAE